MNLSNVTSKTNQRMNTILRNFESVVHFRSEIKGFSEPNGDTSVFFNVESSFLFKHDRFEWECRKLYFKTFTRQNGDVPRTAEMEIIRAVIAKLDLMSSRERYIALLHDVTGNDEHSRVYAFLFQYGDITYIVSITVISRNSQRFLLAFADEYKLTGAVWGPEAERYLTRHGIDVGGRYKHVFWEN